MYCKLIIKKSNKLKFSDLGIIHNNKDITRMDQSMQITVRSNNTDNLGDFKYVSEVEKDKDGNIKKMKMTENTVPGALLALALGSASSNWSCWKS